MVDIIDILATNARVVTYLAEKYPKHKLSEIVALLDMNPLDINNAIWLAQDLKEVEVDREKNSIKFIKAPEQWGLGESFQNLSEKILYMMKKMNEDEEDIEEYVLGSWTSGILAHELLIVLDILVKKKFLASYTITDTDFEGGKNKYTFYTLYENRKEKWGKKVFKRQEDIKVK